MTSQSLIDSRVKQFNWSIHSNRPLENAVLYIDPSGINITIYKDSDDFNLEYLVPHSTFVISLGKAGSFSNDKHFLSFYQQIFTMVNTLRLSNQAETYWK